MDFEEILLEVGDYDKFQKNMIYFFLVPAAFIVPWFCMDILFLTMTPEHWCYVPEVAASNLTLAQQRSIVGPEGDMCHMYNISFSDIDFSQKFTAPNGTATVPCNMGWQYDKTVFESTAAMQFDLVCKDALYVSYTQTLYYVGSIIGTPIYGSLCDRYGRRLTFFIIVLVTAATGMVTTLATDFTTFMFLKTLNGSLYPAIYQIPFIIVFEIVAPEMRTRLNGITCLSWVVGQCILPVVNYYSRTWVTMGLINSSVVLLLLFYYKFLPESPRWLVSMKRYDDASDILCRIAETNGKHVEKTEVLHKLQKVGEKMARDQGEQSTNSWDMVRYPGLRKKFLIITFCWIANAFAYFGLQVNIPNLEGSEHLNFFLLAVFEIPGYLAGWYLMQRFGRRWCSAAGFTISGLTLMLALIEYPHGDVISSVIGKAFAALTYMTTYQQASELYPTVVLSLGLGLSSTIGLIFMLGVPSIIALAVYGKAIPFIIIGGVEIVAGVLAAFLPETLNENLPQTLLDAEEFGKNRKFLSAKRRRCSISRERASMTKGSIRGICGDNVLEAIDEQSEAKNIRKRTGDV